MLGARVGLFLHHLPFPAISGGQRGDPGVHHRPGWYPGVSGSAGARSRYRGL